MNHCVIEDGECRCLCDDNKEEQKYCDFWDKGDDTAWCKYNYTLDGVLSDCCYYPGIARIVKLSPEEYKTLIQRLG